LSEQATSLEEEFMKKQQITTLQQKDKNRTG